MRSQREPWRGRGEIQASRSYDQSHYHLISGRRPGKKRHLPDAGRWQSGNFGGIHEPEDLGAQKACAVHAAAAFGQCVGRLLPKPSREKRRISGNQLARSRTRPAAPVQSTIGHRDRLWQWSVSPRRFRSRRPSSGIDWARSPNASDLPANVSLQIADATKDPIPPADLICSADVLEHFHPNDIRNVVANLHNAGRYNFHVIACYDDGHSHLSIMEPERWLELFRTVSPDYRLVRTWERRKNQTATVCLVANY